MVDTRSFTIVQPASCRVRRAVVSLGQHGRGSLARCGEYYHHPERKARARKKWDKILCSAIILVGGEKHVGNQADRNKPGNE